MKLITTSWDDGSVLDFRLAEYLHKYNLKGTFYIPKTNKERPVMSSQEVNELSAHFEIGGHTLNHVRLHKVDDKTIKSEVGGCFDWLSQVTGTAPISFCFPGGAHNGRVVKAVQAEGFNVLRTTELLNIQPPSNGLLPTTVQVYEHSRQTYLRHLIKRRRGENFFRWMCTASTYDLLKLTESYLQYVDKNGGCFHLWGHSWEIEENNLWQKLEQIFRLLSGRIEFSYVENKDVFTAI